MNEENMAFLDKLNEEQLEKIFIYQKLSEEKYQFLIEQEKVAQQKKKLAKLHGKGENKNGKNCKRRV